MTFEFLIFTIFLFTLPDSKILLAYLFWMVEGAVFPRLVLFLPIAAKIAVTRAQMNKYFVLRSGRTTTLLGLHILGAPGKGAFIKRIFEVFIGVNGACVMHIVGICISLEVLQEI